MAKVSFYQNNGSVDVVDVEPSVTIMRAAVLNGVPGIVGECGGQAMCATCHIYVREEYLDGLPAISEDEEEMLECTAEPRDATRSRLGCQLKAGEAFEEIDVDVPQSQG
jgi:ferredoxin, 2Fe-2S